MKNKSLPYNASESVPIHWRALVLSTWIIPLVFLVPSGVGIYFDGFSYFWGGFLVLGIVLYLGSSILFHAEIVKAIIRRYGIDAEATILQAKMKYAQYETAGISYRLMQYLLEVTPENMSSYQAKTSLWVPLHELSTSYYQPGAVVPVRYLSNKKESVAIIENAYTSHIENITDIANQIDKGVSPEEIINIAKQISSKK